MLLQSRTNADAFTAFYDLYAERLLVFFLRRIFDAQSAMDLTSESFARAFERRGEFRGRTGEQEQGWLFSIARTQLADYWRRGQAERAAVVRLGVEMPLLTDAEIQRVEDLAELKSLAPLLRSAMAALPDEQTVAVRRRVIDEESYAEIAVAMNVSQQVVRARVSRGLRSLAAQLVLDPEEDAA